MADFAAINKLCMWSLCEQTERINNHLSQIEKGAHVAFTQKLTLKKVINTT
jgi:hypothetical protein